ncbi:hypothetical protein Q5425_21080 [Amycolatopsis sp. A133]|uniref:hypothetical protein n=1 Tax=Amycolatopsis sp. A133 TaxID=3064472 RepID=UPI0027FBFF97|nr:hypothetical protein [Amycolatopsis sp. A133]MDQ7806245.1 hypothetical protein [Amycolatopsis sp. A133]
MIAPVTDAERAAAGRWLVKHGVEVPTLTELLALRLGFRGGARPRGSWWWAVVAIVAVVTADAGVRLLPGVRGAELTENAYMYYIVIAFQLMAWLPVRVRDRQALASAGTPALERPPGTGLGGWDIATLLITFAGGAALGGTMFVTTPFRAYAASWLGLLAIGGAVAAVILTGTLRRPVIAEDETSRAVDAALRIQDPLFALPAVYTLPVLFDALDHVQPPGFTPWLIGYAALAVATQAVSAFVNLRRGRAVLAAAAPGGAAGRLSGSTPS